MMDIDFTKEYRLPVCDSLREMRIQSHSMDYGSNIFVADRLESNNYIKIYEYLGGTFYVPQNANEIKDYQDNVVPIAGIMVSIMEQDQIVQVDKIYCEFGYEEYIFKLMEQTMIFADFYGMKVSILDLQKGVINRNNRTCRFIDMKYW